MRDRLIELIKQGESETPCKDNENYDCTGRKCRSCEIEGIADHLIANGVIVSPCKVGDITYLLLEKDNSDYDIIKSKCVSIFENERIKSYSMWYDCKAIGNILEFYPEDFGKTVFLSREDAERALEEVKNDKA